MSLTNSYLTSTKNFDAIMNSILSARAPERFTNKFLEDLGFKSSNDRLITGVLKGVGFLSETGEPTQRYYAFLDQTQSKKILAIGIQEAYEDLFNLRRDAQNMSQDEVKNKLKTLTQGQKGDISTIERSRNVIMHSGELSARDVERIGINIRDWISQVGV